MSFNIKFKINENIEVIVSGLDSMMFAELVYNFGQMVGLKEEHKASYTFNSEAIKANSMRKLSDIGIVSNSVINVKTEKPLDYKPQNTGNSETSQNNSTNSGTPQNNSSNTGTNMNVGNMNMNPNMNAGNMNMNPNMNAGNMNMNPNMNVGNMNMNPNMNFGGMNMNPNMNFGGMNMNPNMNFGAMNMNQNMFYGTMNMNQNMFYGTMNMNQNMNNFANAANNQNIAQNTNNQNIVQNTNNQNIVQNTNNQNIVQNTNNQNTSISPGIPGCMNLIFNNQGKNITIQTQKEAKWCEVATKFANKAGVLDKKPSFLIISQKVDMTCELTVDQLKLKDNMKIDVIYEAEIIGA